MTIYLVRHGHKESGSFFNPALRHQDEPLSESGKGQANRLVSYFADKSIAAIYVSAYLRTRQTAQPLSEFFGIDPIEDERLNELDNGLLDDMSEREFEKTYPEEWKAYVARTADFRFPGGETGQEASERITGFLEEKRRVHKDENIVIVCHEGLIRVGLCYLLGLPVFHRGDFKVDYCGLTEFGFQEDVQRWKLIRFNSFS